MTDQERAGLRDIDRYILEARAAHVYLDAAEALENPIQRRRNLASAREVLVTLERVRDDSRIADAIRDEVKALCERLAERLNRIGD